MFEMEEHKMPNNQSQSQPASKTQASANKPQTQSASASSSSNQSASMNSGATSMNSGSGDAFEETIAKGVSSLMQTLEPQLNRIAGQIANRVMARSHDFADTGVKRMQEQPWYLVGGALALVAVGVGLLFAFDAEQKPDFSKSSIQ